MWVLFIFIALFGRPSSLTVVNPILRSPYQAAISLAGNWELCVDSLSVGSKERWMEQEWPSITMMPVPSNWESHGVLPGMLTGINYHVGYLMHISVLHGTGKRFVVPHQETAEYWRLINRLGDGVTNDWDFWVFPKRTKRILKVVL